jgi:hypothetical protein
MSSLVEGSNQARAGTFGIHVIGVRVGAERTHVVLTPVGARKVHGCARATAESLRSRKGLKVRGGRDGRSDRMGKQHTQTRGEGHRVSNQLRLKVFLSMCSITSSASRACGTAVVERASIEVPHHSGKFSSSRALL